MLLILNLCLKTGNFLTGNDWPFPRINLAIPIYKDMDIAKYTTEQLADGAAEPNFIYYFLGCFPTTMDSVQLKMQTNITFKRNIKFQYNNAIIISSKSIAKYYGVEQIWNKKQMEQKQRQAKTQNIFDEIFYRIRR